MLVKDVAKQHLGQRDEENMELFECPNGPISIY